MGAAAIFGIGGGVIVFAISRAFSSSTDLHGVSSIFDSAASPLCNVPDGCSFLLFSAAVWFLMRAIRIGQAPSRLAYNLEVLTDMTPYEVVEDHASPHYEARLAAKQILDRGIVQGRFPGGMCHSLVSDVRAPVHRAADLVAAVGHRPRRKGRLCRTCSEALR